MWDRNTLVTPEALHSWYHDFNDLGYMAIYRGNDKKPTERIASFVFDSQEDGWAKLSRTVMDQTSGGGVLTIYIARHEKDTSGYTNRYSAPMNIGGALAGMNGPAQPSITQDQVERMVEIKATKMLEEYKLKSKIEALEQENDDLRKGRGKTKGIQATINGIGAALEDNPTLAGIVSPILMGLAAKFLGIGGDEQMAHAMNGPTPPPRKIVHQFSDNSQNDQSDNESGEEVDEDYTEDEFLRIQNAVNELSQVFDDPITILEKIAAYAVKNPAMAKSLLNNL